MCSLDGGAVVVMSLSGGSVCVCVGEHVERRLGQDNEGETEQRR